LFSDDSTENDTAPLIDPVLPPEEKKGLSPTVLAVIGVGAIVVVGGIIFGVVSYKRRQAAAAAATGSA
jgi:hypothetical protein